MNKVLVVDDEPQNVNLLTMMLKSEGYIILKAFNGTQALEIAISQKPDIILLDVMMPGMDGFEVIRRLKDSTITQDIPIVLITALEDTENRVRGLDEGADEFLTKPVHRVEVVARTRGLIRLRTMQARIANELREIPITDKCYDTAQDQQRVLIVEDDEKIVAQLKHYLKEEDYEVEIAKNFMIAEAILREKKPDVILLDLLLGNSSGLDHLNNLKQHAEYEHIPVIIITAVMELDSKVKGLDLGADDYIVKPVERIELLARIRASVRRADTVNSLQKNVSRLTASSFTDSLTGVGNRLQFDTMLEKEFFRAKRYSERTFSLIMADIDYFKAVNDSFGHAAGDRVLQAAAQSFKNYARSSDTVTRYGGEEFCIILPETNIHDATQLAERMRNAAKLAENLENPAHAITLSFGVTQFAEGDKVKEDTINRADAALYQAKRNGRDRVVCIEFDPLCKLENINRAHQQYDTDKHH